MYLTSNRSCYVVLELFVIPERVETCQLDKQVKPRGDIVKIATCFSKHRAYRDIKKIIHLITGCINDVSKCMDFSFVIVKRVVLEGAVSGCVPSSQH